MAKNCLPNLMDKTLLICRLKNHVSNILSKLGVRDRTRAVLKAFELGIV